MSKHIEATILFFCLKKRFLILTFAGNKCVARKQEFFANRLINSAGQSVTVDFSTTATATSATTTAAMTIMTTTTTTAKMTIAAMTVATTATTTTMTTAAAATAAATATMSKSRQTCRA